VVQVAVSEDLHPRFVTIRLYIDGNPRDFYMPILPDGDMHSYSFPIRLLELDPISHLTGIQIYPIQGSVSEKSEIQFGGIRLIYSCVSQNPCVIYYPRDDITPDMVVGEIVGSKVIGQTFISECQGTIDKIDLFVGTYARENKYPLLFKLTDLTSGQLIQSQTIPSASLDDNSWNTIQLDPISDTNRRKYLFSLESPSSFPGNAITIYQSQTDQYSLGELSVSGVPSKGEDLVFRYHCSSNKFEVK
jgi:hypothetical protein